MISPRKNFFKKIISYCEKLSYREYLITDTATIHIDGHTIDAKLPSNWTGIAPLQDKNIELISIENGDRVNAFYENFWITAVKSSITFKELLRQSYEEQTDIQRITSVEHKKKIFWIEIKEKDENGEMKYTLEKVIYLGTIIVYASYFFSGEKFNSTISTNAKKLLDQTKIA